MSDSKVPLSSRRDALKVVGGLGALALLRCAPEVTTDAGAGGGTATGGGGGTATGGGGGTATGGGGGTATGGGGGTATGGGGGTATGGGGGTATGGGGGTATGGGGGTATGGGGGTATDGGTVAWATAGTSVLTGKDYGNPFASGVGATCNLYRSATEGPCHATSNLLTRRDVSEGYAGLPMRLELVVVDTSCDPVPNAIVEIWMTDTLGVYSGDIDGNNDAFCTGGSAVAAAALWGRGIQTAGSDGRVTFDANFPGWYSSRATHIHFKVKVGTTTYVTSQLFFDEALKTDVYTTQPSYRVPSGSGYVLNANDNVVNQSGVALSEVVCSWQKQSDGALLAWKALTINA